MGSHSQGGCNAHAAVLCVNVDLQVPFSDGHGGGQGSLQAEGVRYRHPKLLTPVPPTLDQPVPVHPCEGAHIGNACSRKEHIPCKA